MNRGVAFSAAALGMVLCCLLCLGCGESRQPYAGNYRSVEPFAGKGHIDLELRENGEATWKLTQEGILIKFKWRVENDRLWLYTREGGIIHAIPSDGNQKLSVDMTGQWHPSCPVDYCIEFERVKEGGS